MTVIATDAFNRANGGLGTNWTTHTAWSAPLISSNAIPSVATTDMGATYNAVDAGQDDMYTKVDVTIGTQHINNDCIAICRMPNSAVDDGYFFDSPAYGGTGGGGWTLARNSAGVTTVLASNYGAGVGIQTGTHTIQVQAVGTTIAGYIDGALITSVTDSTHSGATKRRGGLHIYSDGAAYCTLDNWEMGNFASTSAPSAPSELRSVAENSGASLVWPIPSDGGSAITDYLIEQNVNSGGWTTVSHSAQTNADYHVTGLVTGDSVIFRVSAVNAIGTGSASPSSTAITVLGNRSLAHIFTPLLGDYWNDSKTLASGPAGLMINTRSRIRFITSSNAGAVGTTWDSDGGAIAQNYLWATGSAQQINAQVATLSLTGIAGTPSITVGTQTKTAQVATLSLTGVAAIVSTPQTRTAQVATLTLTAVPGAPTVLGTEWSDNFNRADGTIVGSADYDVWSLYGYGPPTYTTIGVVSNAATPDPLFQPAVAVRISAAVSSNLQRVKVTFSDPTQQFYLGLFQTSTAAEKDGLTALWLGNGDIYWYLNTVFDGSTSGTAPTGAGHTFELQYDGTTATYLIDGVSYATHTVSITYASGRTHQSFGFNNVASGTTIDNAEGGLLVVGGSPQTVTAQVASIALTGIAGAPSGGAVTKTAQIATITLSGIAGALTTPVTVTAQVGSITLSGIAATLTPGAVSKAAQVATLTLTAIPGALTTPVSVTAQVATITLAGVAGGVSGGAVTKTAQVGLITLVAVPGALSIPISVTAQVATLTLSAIPATLTPGAVSLAAQVATLSLTAVPGALTTPITVTAQIGLLALSGIPGSLTPGGATLTAQVGSIALSGVPGAASGGAVSMTAQVGQIALSAIAGSMVPGTLTGTAQVGLLSLTAVPGALSPGTATITAQAGAVALTAIPGALTPGGASLSAQVATITLSGVPGATTGGPVTVGAQVGQIVLTGVAAIVSTPQTRTAQVASLTLSAIPATLAIGSFDQSRTAQVGPLSLSGVAGVISGGGATLTAQVATVTLTGIPGTLTPGAVSIAAQVATVTLSAIPGVLVPGAATVTAQVALVTLTAVPGTFSAGGITGTAQVAQITLSAVAATLTVGTLTYTAQVATLSLSGVPGAFVGGDASRTAQVGQLVLSAVPAALLAGAVSIAAQTAGLVLTAMPGALTLGAVTVLAQPAVLALAAVPGSMVGGATTFAAQVGLLALLGVPGMLTLGAVLPFFFGDDRIVTIYYGDTPITVYYAP